jgi:hypothetical protein
MRQAKTYGISDVHLVVNADDEKAAEQTLKQEGMRRIYHKEGLAFLTRETSALETEFPRWVGLLLLPEVTSHATFEYSTHRSHRWDKVREQKYWYTSSYAYMNLPQTLDFLKIPRSDRLLAFSFSEILDAVPRPISQHVGEYRYLQDYPPEVQERDMTVRKDGNLYYDLLSEGPFSYRMFPYTVRRGLLQDKGKQVAPYSLEGCFKYTLTSVEVIECPRRPIVCETDRKPKPSVAYIWHPDQRQGSVPTVRGYYTTVPARWESPFKVFLSRPVDLEERVFRLKEDLYEAFHKVSSQVRFSTSKNDAVSASTLQLKRSVQLGRMETFQPETFSKTNWRLLPGGFVQGDRPVLGSFTLHAFNEGMRYAFFELEAPAVVTPYAEQILRDSGFIKFYSFGRMVYQDLYSHTGVVIRVQGTLDFRLQEPPDKAPIEEEFRMFYEPVPLMAEYPI